METKDMLKEMLRVYNKPLVRLFTDLTGHDGQEVLHVYSGPLGQLLTNLAGENGEEVLIELKKFNRKETCYATQNITLESKMNFRKKKSILRCISEGRSLSIKALDGSRLICDAKDTFLSGIDGNFFKRGINNPGIVTPETSLQVHEIVYDGTFVDIFRALPGTWGQKWLSQDQIIEFCETLSGWLGTKGKVTMFLIKKDENKPIDENYPEDNLVVVSVSVRSGGLAPDVDWLKYNHEWLGENLHRVVSPKPPKRISIPSAV